MGLVKDGGIENDRFALLDEWMSVTHQQHLYGVAHQRAVGDIVCFVCVCVPWRERQDLGWIAAGVYVCDFVPKLTAGSCSSASAFGKIDVLGSSVFLQDDVYLKIYIINGQQKENLKEHIMTN